MYYDDDAPSRRELEAEAFEDAVRESLREAWDETRAGLVLTRTEEHPHMTTLIAGLEAQREAYVDENYDEEASEWADEALYHRDIYAYHGVSRKDFR